MSNQGPVANRQVPYFRRTPLSPRSGFSMLSKRNSAPPERGGRRGEKDRSHLDFNFIRNSEMTSDHQVNSMFR
jgi:hypothetical protein